MSEELNTTELEVENPAENDNSTNEDIQTDEGTNADVDKQEENPYEKELAELRKRDEERKAELEKKEEIIEHKNRAIETLKKKTKEVEESKVEKLEKEIEALKSNLQGDSVKQKISQLTNDPAERELIERHYNNSIVKSGNLLEDLQNAIAIANRSLVLEQKQNRALEEGNENFLATFSKGSGVKGEMPGAVSDPVQREAEALVRSLKPNAVKFVKEQFKK